MMLDQDRANLDALLLEENRNGYIFSPTQEAYESAKRHLQIVHDSLGDRYFSPKIMPEGDGDLSIEWECGSRFVEIYIVPEAKLEENRLDCIFSGVIENGVTARVDHAYWSEEKLKELLAWLLQGSKD
jgi:hypothetical protein